MRSLLTDELMLRFAFLNIPMIFEAVAALQDTRVPTAGVRKIAAASLGS